MLACGRLSPARRTPIGTQVERFEKPLSLDARPSAPYNWRSMRSEANPREAEGLRGGESPVCLHSLLSSGAFEGTKNTAFRKTRSVLGFALCLLTPVTAKAELNERTDSAIEQAGSSTPTARVDLEWHAPPGCPDRVRILRAIERLVAEGKSTHFVRARVWVEQLSSHRFQVRIQMPGSGAAERVIQGQACEALSQAAALIIALAIDPEAAAMSPQPAPPPPTPPAEPAAPKPKAPKAAIVRSERRPTKPPAQTEPDGVETFLTTGIAGERAFMPRVAAGVALGAGLQIAWLRPSLNLSFFPQSSRQVGTVGAEFRLAALEARLCAVPFDFQLGVQACVGLRGHRLWAKGIDVPNAEQHATTIMAGIVGAELRFPQHSLLAAQLGANAVLPFSRPSFEIENLAEPIFRPNAIGMRGTLSLVLSF